MTGAPAVVVQIMTFEAGIFFAVILGPTLGRMVFRPFTAGAPVPSSAVSADRVPIRTKDQALCACNDV